MSSEPIFTQGRNLPATAMFNHTATTTYASSLHGTPVVYLAHRTVHRPPGCCCKIHSSSFDKWNRSSHLIVYCHVSSPCSVTLLPVMSRLFNFKQPLRPRTPSSPTEAPAGHNLLVFSAQLQGLNICDSSAFLDRCDDAQLISMWNRKQGSADASLVQQYQCEQASSQWVTCIADHQLLQCVTA